MSKNISKILILNGANLNLLGQREPDIYGDMTLSAIEDACTEQAKGLNLSVECRQSNHEGELVDAIQGANLSMEGLIINPGGYSHSSIVLRDALLAFNGPIIEVHLSNIYRREDFRKHSYISSVADGVISGLGWYGYILAMESLSRMVKEN